MENRRILGKGVCARTRIHTHAHISTGSTGGPKPNPRTTHRPHHPPPCPLSFSPSKWPPRLVLGLGGHRTKDAKTGTGRNRPNTCARARKRYCARAPTSGPGPGPRLTPTHPHLRTPATKTCPSGMASPPSSGMTLTNDHRGGSLVGNQKPRLGLVSQYSASGNNSYSNYFELVWIGRSVESGLL